MYASDHSFKHLATVSPVNSLYLFLFPGRITPVKTQGPGRVSFTGHGVGTLDKLKSIGSNDSSSLSKLSTGFVKEWEQ